MTKTTQKPESRTLLSFLTNSHHLKFICVVIFSLVVSVILKIIIDSYYRFVAPDNVYGQWVEIDAPSFQSEKLTLGQNGVFRNGRLIATQFDFDGEFVTINHSIGESIYKLAGTYVSPQLHRVHPPLPQQRFILKKLQDVKKD
ncbi:DUF2850 domain-containing protein [Vibrio sagamiensis]|uniref:DUF2850 domain-containing protein n=1 Tax=Vibrio sagamiensis NBRC 104589 TaxID=1219064 RepID=A0A511QDA2_9VIBR|nr:DUF2850 domain-containing protein [Vibrio sagamiensis]GEM75284.1 hypothetical protein VSA01S_13960 [Vibrio sagamiensis NBRC 104589]